MTELEVAALVCIISYLGRVFLISNPLRNISGVWVNESYHYFEPRGQWEADFATINLLAFPFRDSGYRRPLKIFSFLFFGNRFSPFQNFWLPVSQSDFKNCV